MKKKVYEKREKTCTFTASIKLSNIIKTHSLDGIIVTKMTHIGNGYSIFLNNDLIYL